MEGDPEALRVLGNHRDAAGVRVLVPNGGDDATAQLEAIAAGKYWTGLEELELYSFDETDGESEAAAHLFRQQLDEMPRGRAGPEAKPHPRANEFHCAGSGGALLCLDVHGRAGLNRRGRHV